ncbi:MAG TPA: urea ABC transporter permease subunit UrtB [Polyangiaceae bacterium]|nr:urea ABC transporter permease subunit UrtB [Polyangiaceae bacterium]
MFPTSIKTLLRACLGACIVLLGASVPFCARAASLEEALAGMASEDRDRLESAIADLGSLPDPRALAVLQALEAGKLRVEPSGGVFVQTPGGLIDARTGQPATPVDATREPPVNNRLRRNLALAIARGELRSEDAALRLAAATELAKQPSSELDADMRAALAKEQDPPVRELLRVSLASLDLAGSDPEKQLEALRTVESTASVALMPAVRQLASDNNASPPVRDLASSVLSSLERRVMWVSAAANLFYGLSLGSVLLLAALGLAITFGIMRVINMAHGEIVMLGAYSTFAVQNLVRKVAPGMFDLYLLLALPVAFVVCALVGVFLERTVIRFLYGRPLETLLATWGISLGLIQTTRLIFGAQNVAVENPSWLSGGWELAPTVVLPYSRIATILFSVVVVGFVWAMLQKTRLGMYVRAVTQNREMAGNVGIPTRRIDVWTFALGSGVAGLGGVALSQLGNVGPELGQSYIVDCFMVVVLGGVGNVAGTVAGALGLGVANKILEPLTGAVLGKIMLLVILILFIQWRPQGMFAPKGRAAEI